MNKDLPKLVRDKCQELYPDNTYRRLPVSDEWGDLLDKKVREELREVTDAAKFGSREQLIEECADLWEVVDAYFNFLGVPIKDVTLARIRKNRERGTFKQGLVLEECSLWQDTSHIST
jgi:phosphoribosyl-ATP pyrophosphohydrolase